MTSAAQTFPGTDSGLRRGDAAGGDGVEAAGESAAPVSESPTPDGPAPDGWRELREADDIQFAPVEIPDIPEPEPGWLVKILTSLVEGLGYLLRPVALFIAEFWWIVAIAAGALVLLLLARLVGPFARRPKNDAQAADAEHEWQPDRGESLALLADADRLAAEGRFDEATHLLLKRSVGQIAAARPGLVEPSSTARELARLAALPEAARSAFAVVAERVERSLFALGALSREDWEAARAAYARFALADIDGVRIDRSLAA